MDATTLYHLLTSQLPEKPDLSCVQTPQPCPEHWPLLLAGVEKFRGKIQAFIVSDGKTQVTCCCTMEEAYNKLVLLEPGAIIHLKGSTPRFHDASKQYRLEVDQVLTLKEYDAEVSRQKAMLEKRKARLKAMMEQEGYFEFEQAPAVKDSTSAQEQEDRATASSI